MYYGRGTEYGECEDISWLRSISSEWELLKNVDTINNPFKELAWKNKEGNRTSIRKKNNSERVCLFVCLSWEISENMDYFQLSVEVGTGKMICWTMAAETIWKLTTLGQMTIWDCFEISNARSSQLDSILLMCICHAPGNLRFFLLYCVTKV